MQKSIAYTMFNAFVKITAPRIGNTPLAAFLKKSLRDWSSWPFIFSFSIMIKIIKVSLAELPKSGNKFS